MLSDDEVTWAYRLFLDRDPESHDVLARGGVANLVEIAVAGISGGISLSHHAARSMH